MIFALLFNAILLPVHAAIDLLPTGTSLALDSLATTVVSSGTFPALGWVNDYVPIATATACVELIATFLTLSFTLQLVIWVYLKIWGSD